ncbi:MAG TPA: cytochrome c oxidase subunit IVB [Pseudogracilibacillus sp.]|nr:cytochrome c oxidase subunit IVB [Pseudogracilibacillus sp.]
MTDQNLSKAEVFRREKNKKEMQRQLISFGLMIALTLIAFVIVASDVLNKGFIVPIIFVMAIVQAGFQFYYFMHLKEKGHAMPATLIFGGVWCAFLTLAGIVVISWW